MKIDRVFSLFLRTLCYIQSYKIFYLRLKSPVNHSSLILCKPFESPLKESEPFLKHIKVNLRPYYGEIIHQSFSMTSETTRNA